LHVSNPVKLEVYSSLGQKIETLVDEFQDAGIHKETFDLNSKYSSGIYLYQLSAGSFPKLEK